MDWGCLRVADVHPSRIPDLFSGKAVVLTGGYVGPGRETVHLRGRAGGHEVARAIAIDLPADEPRHDAIAAVWARQRVADLTSLDYAGAHRNAMREDLRQQITQLGLDYRLSTPFTSFVAVEERVVTSGGSPRRIEVPVNMPEGMSYQGVFGKGGGIGVAARQFAPPPPPPPPVLGTVNQTVTVQAGVAGGLPGGVVGSPATLERIGQLGVEVIRPAGRDLQLTAWIAIEKLVELSQLEAVRYVVQWKAA